MCMDDVSHVRVFFIYNDRYTGGVMFGNKGKIPNLLLTNSAVAFFLSTTCYPVVGVLKFFLSALTLAELFMHG